MKINFFTNGYVDLRKIVRIILVVIVIGLAVNLLITFVLDNQEIFQSLKKIKLTYLLIPFFAFLLSNLIDTVRLKLVLSQFQFKISLLQAFYNSVIGIFFTNITPMAAGGQPFQIFHLTSLKLDMKTATNVVLSRFVEHAITSMVIMFISLKYILQITEELGIGKTIIYTGLGFTGLMAVLLLIILIRPQIIGKLALLLEKSIFGKLIAKVTKNPNWAQIIHKWTDELRDNIKFLWTEKLYIMLLDILLGLCIIFIHVFSLYYIINLITSADISFWVILVTHVIIWQIIFYIPTPGASGSVEAAFAMVYGNLTGLPELTFISIFVWRIASYYMHILFGGIIFSVYMKTGRVENTAS